MNVTDLWTKSNSEIMESLSRTVLEDIPKGIKSADDLERMEYLLGKLANDYVYLITLLNHARNYVRQLKRKGKEYQAEYEDMIDKRDSLEAIASAVKLQYSAVSRMLTVKIEKNEELSMYDYRRESSK
jgi:hypothetical protein